MCSPRKTDIVFKRLTPEKKAIVDQMWASDRTMGEISRAVGVADATVRRYLLGKGHTDLNRYRTRTKKVQIHQMLMAGESPTEVSEKLGVWDSYVLRELRSLMAAGKVPRGRVYKTEYKCGGCGKRVTSPVYGVFHPTRELELKQRFCSKVCAATTKKRFTGSRYVVVHRPLLGEGGIF